jgi:hypothetical protein
MSVKLCAVSGTGPQEEVVLVQGLPPGSGRLEVAHGLDGERLPAKHRQQAVADPRVQQPLQAHRIPSVHLHHPRVAPERVTGLGTGAGRVLRARAAARQRHEVAAVAPGLAPAEQLPGDCETIPVESGTERIAHDQQL